MLAFELRVKLVDFNLQLRFCTGTFQVVVPGDNYLPVIDSDTMTNGNGDAGITIFPSEIKTADFTYESLSTREDTVNNLFYINIEDLQPFGDEIDQYSFIFFLQGPPFSETIDLS